MNTKQKILHWIYVAMIVIGAFCILGAAGRADTTDAALSSLLIQLGISAAIAVIGGIGLHKENKQEEREDKSTTHHLTF
ncbi:MAG: hypothetical protein PUC71_05155 [Oscillospiraceae bacterium]|nr:hypothetical protein [Oscillospiraceae bacterium]